MEPRMVEKIRLLGYSNRIRIVDNIISAEVFTRLFLTPEFEEKQGLECSSKICLQHAERSATLLHKTCFSSCKSKSGCPVWA